MRCPPYAQRFPAKLSHRLLYGADRRAEPVILGLSGATIILYRFAQAFFAAIQKGLMSKKSQVEKARATADSESEMANRLRYFAERQNEVTETIRQLVEIESPSDNKQA